MQHPLRGIVKLQKQGIAKGICSVCSANEMVIEATLEHALETDGYALIEATCNQVNQFGGYTGMAPADFRDMVFDRARDLGLPRERLILGGDHLGPKPWQNESPGKALEKAIAMVKEYVKAGFSKIHLDASMPLAGDLTRGQKTVDPEVIADREARLCQAAEEAAGELAGELAGWPVYVIGTEVPVPGGTSGGETVRVTRPEDLRHTVEVSKAAFKRYGLEEAWQRVIAVVVQPGVEFDDQGVHDYDRKAAQPLIAAGKSMSNLVFEGHSTDYQRSKALGQLVEDGVAILKVGPALTFAFREAVFALAWLEEELADSAGIERSNLVRILDEAMVENPVHWQSYYFGSEATVRLACKYSYSDRSRYYWAVPKVKQAVQTLVNNLKSVSIPETLLSQFLPNQYAKVRNGQLSPNDPEAIIKDRIKEVLQDYYQAVHPASD